MVKITNLSTAHIAIAGGNLAPGKSKDVEIINASLDRLIQSGALMAEPVKPIVVSYKEPKKDSAPTFVGQTFKSSKKEKN